MSLKQNRHVVQNAADFVDIAKKLTEKNNSKTYTNIKD